MEEQTKAESKSIFSPLTEAFQSISNTVGNTTEQMTSNVQAEAKKVQDSASSAIEGAKDSVTNATANAQQQLSTTIEGAKDTASTALEGAKQQLSTTIEEAKVSASTAIENTQASLNKTVDAVADGATEALQKTEQAQTQGQEQEQEQEQTQLVDSSQYNKQLYFDVIGKPNTMTGPFEYNGRHFIYEIYFHTIKTDRAMVDHVAEIFGTRQTYNKDTATYSPCLGNSVKSIKQNIRNSSSSAFVRVIDSRNESNIASGTIQIANVCKHLNASRDPDDLSKADIWIYDVCRTCDYTNADPTVVEYCENTIENSPLPAFFVLIQEYILQTNNNYTIKLSIETDPPNSLMKLTKTYSRIGFVDSVCDEYSNMYGKEYKIMERTHNDTDVIRVDFDSATQIMVQPKQKDVPVSTRASKRLNRATPASEGFGLEMTEDNAYDNAHSIYKSTNRSSNIKYKNKYRTLKKRYNSLKMDYDELQQNYNMLETNHMLLKKIYDTNTRKRYNTHNSYDTGTGTGNGINNMKRTRHRRRHRYNR